MLRQLMAALTVLLVPGASFVLGQSVEKPRLAIRTIACTPAVHAAARASNQWNTLEQILQGADPLLVNSINNTRRFEIVARGDLADVFKEQDLVDSGNVNLRDPQTARAFELAGARYVATVTVDNYQDITQRAEIAGQFGRNQAERRTIQIQATLKVFDTTSGVLKESSTISLEASDLSEVLPGVDQQGRATNRLIGDAARNLAEESANAIMNALAPARVLGYTLGVITFNRGEGTGVREGQFWEVFHPGRLMVDPDTGEVLGSEEVPIGWARVIDVAEKFSRAQAIADNGIDCGSILRLRKAGLPGGIDPNARAAGSADCGGGAAPAPRQPASEQRFAPAPVAAPRIVEEPAGVPGEPGVAPAEPVRLAILVGNVAPNVPDQKVEVLANYLTAAVTSPSIELINRADVVNAVANLAREGPNRGTNDPIERQVERLLSDRASAVRLAENLGADGLLVANITSLHEDERDWNDPDLGVRSRVVITTLDVDWRMLDGASGGSIASDTARAQTKIRQTPNLKRSPASIDDLLMQASGHVGPQVQAHLNRGRRPSAAESAQVAVVIGIELQDLNVPEIRQVKDPATGREEWTITANRYQLVPMGCEVLVDGFLVGSAPGEVRMAPGLHRVRIEHPALEPVDRMINARDGLRLQIAMQMTAEGRQRWMEQTRFLETLKAGAILRDAEIKQAEAFAQFLKNSRVTIDTSQLQNLSFWQRFFR